jgi:hypothetical protein
MAPLWLCQLALAAMAASPPSSTSAPAAGSRNLAAASPTLLSWSLAFSDGVVLQRSSPVVYGQLGPDPVAALALSIAVTLVGPDGRKAASVTAEVRNGDSFRAELPPQAKGWGFTVVASLDGGSAAISLRNVSFGEVVLCSGQSNVRKRVRACVCVRVCV